MGFRDEGLHGWLGDLSLGVRGGSKQRVKS